MADYSKLGLSDIQLICSEYDLKVHDFKPIDAGTANSNYLIETIHEQFILTVLELDRARASRLAQLIQHLVRYKFPTSRLILNNRGQLNTEFSGKPVILKSFIPGEMLSQPTEERIQQVGERISLLHQIPVPDYLPRKFSYGCQTFPEIFTRGDNPDFEGWLARKYDAISAGFPGNLPCGLVHGDVFFDNVIFDLGEFKAIIDFEEACYHPRIFDLGMAAVGLCLDNSKLVPSKVKALVAGYQKNSALNAEEKANLKFFVIYGAVATSRWRFWKFNLDRPDKLKANTYQEMVYVADQVTAISNDKFMENIFPES